MIIFHLPVLLVRKGWKQAELARKTGIRPNTISDLYNGFASGISIQDLEAICKVLECGISDIIEYIPDNNDMGKEFLNNPVLVKAVESIFERCLRKNVKTGRVFIQ